MTETETAAKTQIVDPAAPGNRIVVGVDGSEGSLAAMTWALHEARLRDATLHVVLGWGHHPSWGGAGLGSMFPLGYTTSGGGLGGGLGGSRISAPIEAPLHTAQDLETDAAALATRVLDQVINDAVERDADSTQQSVKITRAAIPGHGAKVLLDEVTESDLLVVGSRGHGGFVGALLGSVSHHVVAQAPCPVVVVPDRQSEETR
jgi:nucleotide-binding universal stress UspA family protein